MLMVVISTRNKYEGREREKLYCSRLFPLMDSVQNMQCCSNKMVAYFIINKQTQRQTYRRAHQQELRKVLEYNCVH